MAAPSLTYSLSNGATADASQVMQNYNDLLNGITDGTKDLTISALTVNGAASFKGAVTLGDATADDITVTGSLASSIPIKTTNAFDIGSSSLGLRAAYFGANSQTVKIIGSASMSATWTLTLPVTAGTANYLLATDGSGGASWVSNQSTTLQPKQYVNGTSYTNGTQPIAMTGPTGFSVIRGTLIPYQTSDGAWRLRVDVVATITGRTVGISSIDSVNVGCGVGTVFKNTTTYQQAGTTATSNAHLLAGPAYATANGNLVTCSVLADVSGGTWNILSLTGDFELDAKPGWAD